MQSSGTLRHMVPCNCKVPSSNPYAFPFSSGRLANLSRTGSGTSYLFCEGMELQTLESCSSFHHKDSISSLHRFLALPSSIAPQARSQELVA
uniref:Reticuline oxidase n=1 Tax=Rhizophora mucronata TaxID=61149 RepID=A0A2P2QAR9_RHIMU